MNEKQVITLAIVLAILYFWNKRKAVVSTGVNGKISTSTEPTLIDQGGVQTGIEPGSVTDPTGISTIPPRIVVDVDPVWNAPPGAQTYGPATHSPAVGVDINTTGATFNDMIFADGSPRILTYSQLANMEESARLRYVTITGAELAIKVQTMPDVIAWTAY